MSFLKSVFILGTLICLISCSQEKQSNSSSFQPVCNCRIHGQQRIVGGEIVSPNVQVPWMVSLGQYADPLPSFLSLLMPNVLKKPFGNCGGTIVKILDPSNIYILTAAHCGKHFIQLIHLFKILFS